MLSRSRGFYRASTGRWHRATMADVARVHVGDHGHGALEAAADRIALAAILDARGRGREARDTLGQAVPVLESILGAEHYEVGVALDSLAAMYSGAGEHRNAAALYSRALRIFERTLGTGHPRTRACRANRDKAVAGSGQ